MAKWKFEVRKGGNRIWIRLLRGSSNVGGMGGFFREPDDNPKFFVVMGISINKRYQEEYMKAHNGQKMGEALGLELLKSLKKEGISYIRLGSLSKYGARVVERGISSGGIEKNPEGFLKINWEKLPATEEAMNELVGKLRAVEAEAAGKLRAVEAEAAAKRANEAKAKADARAAKIKRVREFAKRVFRRRSK